jgi:Uma2 family endonuclease
MTTLLRPPEGVIAEPSPPVELHPRYFVLDGISWRTYSSLVNDLNEQHVSVTYDEGMMVLMSPLPRHERIKKVIGSLFTVIMLERDVPIASFGSTTWKRKKLKKGLEPDECFYVQHEALVSGRFDIDLRRDPPPDLAIEVDITHHPMDRLRIYAALGVNEVWRYDGERVLFLKLQGDRTYAPIERSDAFPWLSAEVVTRHVGLLPTLGEQGLMRAFRDWLRGQS